MRRSTEERLNGLHIVSDEINKLFSAFEDIVEQITYGPVVPADVELGPSTLEFRPPQPDEIEEGAIEKFEYFKERLEYLSARNSIKIVALPSLLKNRDEIDITSAINAFRLAFNEFSRALKEKVVGIRGDVILTERKKAELMQRYQRAHFPQGSSLDLRKHKTIHLLAAYLADQKQFHSPGLPGPQIAKALGIRQDIRGTIERAVIRERRIEKLFRTQRHPKGKKNANRFWLHPQVEIGN